MYLKINNVKLKLINKRIKCMIKIKYKLVYHQEKLNIAIKYNDIFKYFLFNTF